MEIMATPKVMFTMMSCSGSVSESVAARVIQTKTRRMVYGVLVFRDTIEAKRDIPRNAVMISSTDTISHGRSQFSAFNVGLAGSQTISLINHPTRRAVVPS